MPLDKISVSSNSKIEFHNLYFDELLDLLKLEHNLNNSKVLISTNSEINIPSTNLLDLKIFVDEKLFSKKFGKLIIDSNSTLSTSVQEINSILDVLISDNKVDYVKGVELVSSTKTEITFNIYSKIGLTIPLVIELPITLDRFLILNFKVKNGVKIFLKLINSILKFSTNKTIIGADNNIRLDIRELIKIPSPWLYIIDNWINKINGNIYFDENVVKLDLYFKVDKTPFDELDITSTKS